MPEPLVSVVIPTVDRPAFLRVALASALAQTWSNTEIIVTDDCGSAENARIVESFGDPRVRYIRHPQRKGMLLNNVLAFREARGEFVANLHDDDEWQPELLATLVPRLVENPELSVAFCDHYIMDGTGAIDMAATEITTRTFGRDRLREGVYRPFWELALVHGSVPCVMAAVFRKEAIQWDDFPEDVDTIYDEWLGYLACRDGWGAYYLPRRLSKYRQHAGQHTTKGTLRVRRGRVATLVRYTSDERLSAIRPALARRLALLRCSLGRALLQAGETTAARRCLLQGWRAAGWRDIGALALTFSPKHLSTRTIAALKERSYLRSTGGARCSNF